MCALSMAPSIASAMRRKSSAFIYSDLLGALSGPGFDLLREVPLMPFRILGAIAAVAVKRVCGVFKDLSARLPGAFKMLVHIFDVDVEVLCCLAEPLRMLFIRGWGSLHYHVVPQLHGGRLD